MIKSYLHKTVIIIGLLMVSISQTGMVFIAPKAAMISNSSNTLKLSDNLGVNQGLSNNVSFIEKANLKHVYVNFSDGFSEAELMSYANPENFSYEFKTADIWLSTKDIARLTLNPKVLSIIEVSPAQFMSGGFLTEGYSDASHGIQSYLQNGNSAGEGIKIGVISNGVNNIQTAIASGDIPADVVIMKDRYIGDEGTAMLEILHDIAPAAKLYFSDSGNSTIGLNNSIKRLVDAGCNIIVDDAVYISEPFFEDGIVAKYIESYATPKGVLYISSAGNFADSHYQGTFTSTYNKPNYEQDFSQGVGSIQHLPFTVLANSKVMVVLQWNDPYKDSKNDLFLKVCDSSLMTTCFTSDNAQLGVGYSPYELVTLSNTTNASLTYYVGVYSFTPKTNVQIELYTFNGRVLNYGVEADSIFGHATSKDVLAIAATNQNAISVKRPYSSIGPFTMLDGTTRNKPDFTGVDNVTVSGTGGFTSPLNGTSAAAPHIAGIAALLWSNAMTLSRTDLIALIKSNTLDLMQEGFDVNTGYGFVTLNNKALTYSLEKGQSLTSTLDFDRIGMLTILDSSIANVSNVSYTSYYDFGRLRYRYSFTVNATKGGTSSLILTDGNQIILKGRTIDVHASPVGIELSPADYTITLTKTGANQSHQVIASVLPLDASNQNLNWTSEDEGIATVNNQGIISAVSTGSTIVHLMTQEGGFIETVLVNVLDDTTPKLICGLNQNISVGMKLDCQLINSKPLESFTLSSIDPKIAMITDGKVWINSIGTTTIIATSSSGLQYSALITVTSNDFNNLLITRDIKGTYHITWNVADSTYLKASYNITRCRINPSTYECIKDGDYKEFAFDNQTSFNDPSDLSKEYYYRITAGIRYPNGKHQYLVSDSIWPNNGIKYDLLNKKIYVSSKYNVASLNQILRGTVVDANKLSLIQSVTGTQSIKPGMLLDTTNDLFQSKLAGSINVFPVYLDIIVIPELSTPINGISTAISMNSLSLSWDLVPYASEYTVYRSTSLNGSYTKINTTSSNTFLDTGLVFNASYFYKIMASTTVESQLYTSSLSVAFSAKVSLPLVSNAYAKPTSYTTNYVAWLAIVGSNGYEIYTSKGASTTYVLLKTVTSSSFSHTGLTINTQYNYKVRAYRLVGTSKVYGAFSSVVSSTPVPSNPSSLSLVLSTSSSIKVTWTAVSGATGYELSYATSVDGVYTKLAIMTSTSASITSLTASTTYYVRVRAYRLVGTIKVYGGYSSIVYK